MKYSINKTKEDQISSFIQKKTDYTFLYHLFIITKLCNLYIHPFPLTHTHNSISLSLNISYIYPNTDVRFTNGTTKAYAHKKQKQVPALSKLEPQHYGNKEKKIYQKKKKPLQKLKDKSSQILKYILFCLCHFVAEWLMPNQI